ncbi:hypothetical protein HAALTHF_16120n [Vreelandella aquamarina]|nr:hypothetical protein HAALTHF_16120n [Halomonas axialensis]
MGLGASTTTIPLFLTPEELARDAQECLAAGASAMHVHVREAGGRHLLDAGAYRDAISAIKETVGDQLLLQVTSEAGGRYSPLRTTRCDGGIAARLRVYRGA